MEVINDSNSFLVETVCIAFKRYATVILIEPFEIQFAKKSETDRLEFR